MTLREAVFKQPRSKFYDRSGHLNWFSLTRLALPALIWVGTLFVQIFNWGEGGTKALALLLVLLATGALSVRDHGALRVRDHKDSSVSLERWNTPLVVACGVLLAVHLGVLVKHLTHPQLFDGPIMTELAGRALLAGLNPYELPIDRQALAITGDPALSGYKYGPLMALGYLPLGVSLGHRGVLLTNLVLQLGTLWLIYQLALRLGTRTTALLAVLFYLSLPIVMRQVFDKGATDLLAVVPLLAALAFEDRPGIAGFLVGLSISTKPVPGALMVPCALPPAGRRASYFIGLIIGLVPTLVVLTMSPVALYDNMILFNMIWPADGTSWLASAPAAVGTIMKAIVVGAFLVLCVAVWRHPPRLATRCGLMSSLTILLLLTGPAAHHNYQLWWIPLISVLVALEMTRQTTADASRPQRFVSGLAAISPRRQTFPVEKDQHIHVPPHDSTSRLRSDSF